MAMFFSRTKIVLFDTKILFHILENNLGSKEIILDREENFAINYYLFL